jgi:hypothetical protein
MAYLEDSKELLIDSVLRSLPSHIWHEERSALEIEGQTFPDDGVMLGELGDRGALMRKIVESSARKQRARIEFLKYASISRSEDDLLKAGRIMMDPYLDPTRLS